MICSFFCSFDYLGHSTKAGSRPISDTSLSLSFRAPLDVMACLLAIMVQDERRRVPFQVYTQTRGSHLSTTVFNVLPHFTFSPLSFSSSFAFLPSRGVRVYYYPYVRTLDRYSNGHQGGDMKMGIRWNGGGARAREGLSAQGPTVADAAGEAMHTMHQHQTGGDSKCWDLHTERRREEKLTVWSSLSTKTLSMPSSFCLVLKGCWLRPLTMGKKLYAV